ncbi:alpha/beta fold hydrolase [Sphingomonas sp. UNC305MFCol5.2]|uniref:alpha/beta fold hydrolase n=1 Tax=Sphingomonas sp. UNC305MFCol5.2 TaxID=1449076 RepID=UPI0004A72CAE|nr:alpha/beta hydrolase [Sphingomonas sp. UNC305MFCol5.2]
MIARILFALAATASIPAILGPQPAYAAIAPANLIQMDHISVQVIGKGSPVILIPGLSSPRAVWDGVAPELAKSHTVYLVQVNGFGGDAPGANLQPGILDGMVADLHNLIADQKLEDAAVVGHSMGGLVGLMLAKAHAGDVGKLMIVDSLPFVGEIFVPGATMAALEPQAKMFRDQMAAMYGKPVPDAVLQGIAANNALKPESQAKVIGWSRAADMRVAGQAMYEDMTTDLRADMGAITTPMTIVYPWSEARMPQARADAFYRAQYAKAPHVTYAAVGDSGHFIMLDQPLAFAAALNAFLAG